MDNTQIVTGVPRGGTSLFLSLVDKHTNALCFSEPEWLKEVRETSHTCSQFTEGLGKKISTLRRRIRKGQAVSIELNNKGAGLPDNYYVRNAQGKVINKNKKTFLITLPKDKASAVFFIKSNTQMTACLTNLTSSLVRKPICIIRNPLATLLSWRSLNIPVSKGKLAIAFKYDKDSQPIQTIENLLVRQVKILDWFFKRFRLLRNDIHLLRYEDLITSPNQELLKVPGITLVKRDFERLENLNSNPHYNLNESEAVAHALIKNGTDWKFFYSIEDLNAIMLRS
jgi:hypothetical protein